MIEALKNILRSFGYGKRLLTSPDFQYAKRVSVQQDNCLVNRTKIINYLLAHIGVETRYLEIGVRDTKDNFDHVMATQKIGVDPGYEHQDNQATFRMTSDKFFSEFTKQNILTDLKEFDVIFLDGGHHADQVDRDIKNSLNVLSEQGFVLLHDCNPPTEWHARESFEFKLTPAEYSWNGTVWKAFTKWRKNNLISMCCIDCDWGVGIISKSPGFFGSPLTSKNEFFEYQNFARNRAEQLNLIDFETLKRFLSQS